MSLASAYSQVSAHVSIQGVNVAVSIQMYAIYIPGKCPCGLKSQVILNAHGALTWDTNVLAL